MATQNKGYIIQSFGANSGSWGLELNTNMIEVVDRNVGGVLSLSLPADFTTPGNVVLTNIAPTWQAQQSTIVLTGSPSYAAYPTIIISTPAVGFVFVNNQITLPVGQTQYPEIRIKNSTATTYAVVPANSSATVILDTNYGARLAGQQGFASGTSTLFFNTNAPYGWTKSTTHNNKALRIVNTSGGGSANTAGFTSVFAARTIAQANLPNISVTGSTSDTSKTLTGSCNLVDYHNSSVTVSGIFTKTTATNISVPSSTSGGTYFGLTLDATHSHNVSVSLGGSGTALDFAVAYVDAIICTKD